MIARAGQNIGEADLRISDLQATRLDEVMQLLHEAQNELNQLDEQVRAAEDVLRRTEIRAQRDGTIVDLQVHTAGGVIVPGARLLDIVLSDDRLVIEARIEPDDIDVVEAGLPARVRLTAFSQRNLKPIEARVMWVSADRLVDERTGEAFFLAWNRAHRGPGRGYSRRRALSRHGRRGDDRHRRAHGVGLLAEPYHCQCGPRVSRELTRRIDMVSSICSDDTRSEGRTPISSS